MIKNLDRHQISPLDYPPMKDELTIILTFKRDSVELQGRIENGRPQCRDRFMYVLDDVEGGDSDQNTRIYNACEDVLQDEEYGQWL